MSKIIGVTVGTPLNPDKYGGGSGELVVTFEGDSRDTASHTSSYIYSHIANGGTAVFFDGNHYSNLTMCEPNEAVFCQVWDDNTIYRLVVSADAGFEEQEIYIPQSGGGGEGGGSTATEYNRVSVRDYGAVGDGVADDRQAIIDAFTAAKSMLPCEVYFPAGTYGISNGITVDMAYGTGGLLVRGAGRDITTIKYLESYDPNQAGNQWYAIRIWPVGMPNTKPTAEDDYLHDISYTGLTVYDTDPIAHAWNPAKGDPDQEETHGFDLHFSMKGFVKARALWDYGGSLAALLGGCPPPGLSAPPRPAGLAGTRNQDKDTCPDPLATAGS